jgi:N-dimethylarginine dimethylaminohydrolase
VNIYLDNEYDKIQYYLLVYPCKFHITDSANPNYGTVDMELVFQQYNDFVNLIINQGIRVQFLDIMNSTEQVYTRDIGFVIKDIFFISKLKSSERADEIRSLMRFVEKYKFKYHIMQNNIEGGDVVMHDKEIFIGLSDRTTQQGIDELQRVLDQNNIDKKTIPVNFDKSKIHLDCAFNTLDKDSCVITEYLYDVDLVTEYFKNIIQLSKEQADEYGTNYAYLGGNTLISSSKSTSELLKSHGYDVYYHDFTEIAKGEGSFGCSTLPILRLKE